MNRTFSLYFCLKVTMFFFSHTDILIFPVPHHVLDLCRDIYIFVI